jgi:hypothetical protein
MSSEHFQTGSKIVRGRGRAQKSIDLIDAMYAAAEEAQPITGRGIGYKLFTRGLIASMETGEMAKVYRLLREAREEETIPWEWIVDETRELEKVSTWDDPEDYARTVARSYRRDFWKQQSERVEVWSEKGTVRGVLQPVLDKYAVGFRVMHGYSSATSIYDVANDGDDKPLNVLYVGDRDPSGMHMSEIDLPQRIEKYGGDHIDLQRIALTEWQVDDLQSFSASDKKKDPRYTWFVENYGKLCWELDAMDPRDLREIVEEEIRDRIEPVAWARCEQVNKAEQESLRTVLDQWGAS